MNQIKNRIQSWMLLTLACCFFVFQSIAQNPTISGKVIDPTTSKPIEGASVSTKNGKSTVTNAAGVFTIAASKGEQLKVSFVGYEDLQITVVTGYFNICLHPSNNQLDDVVVTALGIK